MGFKRAGTLFNFDKVGKVEFGELSGWFDHDRVVGGEIGIGVGAEDGGGWLDVVCGIVCSLSGDEDKQARPHEDHQAHRWIK
jgi:hypothetical protein